MYSISTCFRAYVNKRISSSTCKTFKNFIFFYISNTHRFAEPWLDTADPGGRQAARDQSDVEPSHSKQQPSHSKQQSSHSKQEPQKLSSILRRSVFKPLTVLMSAGDAVRSNQEAEHH